MNGEYSVDDKLGIWQKLKGLLNEALELGLGAADEMKKDVDLWEEEQRLQSPAADQKHRRHCQENG